MSTVALCLLAVAIVLACSRNGPLNSLFETAGYHVRDGTVYYLNAFPGKAFERAVHVNGNIIPDAGSSTFQVLQGASSA